ncbi:PHP domain-containing protein [Streptomyces cyaneofuscatus]|uniref:PHP domain-containing protein n=1 Tax=Streptomyces cyaneofuscatus TaxID=66883 RepID=UPI00378926A8
MDGGVQLHVASGHSARFGASHPHRLAVRAAVRGSGTLALTDRDTMAGTARFAKAAAGVGVRPVLGVDLAVAPYAPASAGQRGRAPVRGGAYVVEAPVRVTLLARSVAGAAVRVRAVRRNCLGAFRRRRAAVMGAPAHGAGPLVCTNEPRARASEECLSPACRWFRRSGSRCGTGVRRRRWKKTVYLRRLECHDRQDDAREGPEG